MQRVLIFLLFISNIATAQVDLNLGLRAYYPFTGNANDASGNNNHAVFNNATLTSDRHGFANSAYSFNGIDNFIRIPNSPSINFTSQMTLCAWVKVSGFYQGTCHNNAIVMKGDAENASGNYQLRFSDEIYTNYQNCSVLQPDKDHQVFTGHNTTSVVANPLPYIQKEKWYSLVWIFDGTTVKMYVNCELILQGSSSQAFTNSSDLYLGAMNNAIFPYWFNGVMDEVRIYDRALNTDEINAYGGCTGISPPPDLTSSQFYTTTHINPGGTIYEVITVRNVGTGATTAPLTFNITKYSALTGLTQIPIPAGTTISIGFTNYTISSGWSFNAATSTFSYSNLILPGGSTSFGISITRGTGLAAGANGFVTQTTTIPQGTAGGETPGTNNTLSNSILKNSP